MMMINEPQDRTLTGGDLDADVYQAEVDGDEAVGGTTAVPGQNDTEDLAQAAGVSVDDRSPLHIKDTLDDRDRDRWELDPDSAR
jgi:hypothetical protein